MVLIGSGCVRTWDSIRRYFSGMPATVVESPAEFERLLPPSDVGIAIVPHLDGSWYDMLRRSAHLSRVVLVTDLALPGIINLRFLPAAFVISVAEAAQAAVAAEELSRHAPLNRLVEILEGDSRLDRSVRDVVLSLLRADPPIRSVKQLSRHCQRDRRTIWLQLRSHGGAKQLLDSVLLLRLIHAARDNVSWAVVAKRTGISIDRMHRLSKRYLNGGLPALRSAEAQTSCQVFIRQVLGREQR